MSKITVHTPAPVQPETLVILELTLLEAQELRAILLATYMIESDLELRLSAGLKDSGFSSMGPFATKRDADGDLTVYRREGEQ